MPSITRLLNRKKLIISNNYDNKEKVNFVRNDDRTVELNQLPNTQDTSSLKPTIQQSTRRKGQASQFKLISWTKDQLKEESNPIGKALLHLMKYAEISALYLSTVSPPAGCPVQHFLSHAAFNPGTKLELWHGLRWDPTFVPEVWSQILLEGYAEISPPGSITQPQSNRNLIRAALGITRNDYLTLIRAGSSDQCKGVVLIISNQSLLPNLKPALDTINHLKEV